MKRMIGIVAAVVLTAVVSHADTFAVNDEWSGNIDGTNGISQFGTEYAGCLFGTDPKDQYAAILQFELPTIPAGHEITAASFSAKLSAARGGPDTDVYGLGFKAAKTNTDLWSFYIGANDASATKMYDDLVGSAAAGDIVTTGNNAALVAWLNSNYSNGGAPLQPVAVMRLNANAISSAGGYDWNAFGAGGDGTLDITTSAIPEPAAIGLFGLVGASILFVRRYFLI